MSIPISASATRRCIITKPSSSSSSSIFSTVGKTTEKQIASASSSSLLFAKKSHHAMMIKPSSYYRSLNINASMLSSSRRNYRTSSNNHWIARNNNSNKNSPASSTYAKHQKAAVTSAFQKRFQSTSPNNKNNNRLRNENSTLTTFLSTLGSILAADTGTFASTLIAVYLATVVETSAHDFLYEYFPHWYADVHEEELPTCLKNREVGRRRSISSSSTRNTGSIMELNNGAMKGVEMMEDDGADGRRSFLMGMDGWMEQQPTLVMNDDELLAEEEMKDEVIANTVLTTPTSNWQRKMTAKRESITKEEEQEFLHGFLSTSNEGATTKKTVRTKTKNIQEEASRKLQERLVSLAMTA